MSPPTILYIPTYGSTYVVLYYFILKQLLLRVTATNALYATIPVY